MTTAYTALAWRRAVKTSSSSSSSYEMQSRDQTSNLLINCFGDEPHQQISPCIISTHANEKHVHIKLYKGKGHYTARPLFKTVLRFRITKLEKKHPTLQKYNRSSNT